MKTWLTRAWLIRSAAIALLVAGIVLAVWASVSVRASLKTAKSRDLRVLASMRIINNIASADRMIRITTGRAMDLARQPAQANRDSIWREVLNQSQNRITPVLQDAADAARDAGIPITQMELIYDRFARLISLLEAAVQQNSGVSAEADRLAGQLQQNLLSAQETADQAVCDNLQQASTLRTRATHLALWAVWGELVLFVGAWLLWRRAGQPSTA